MVLKFQELSELHVSQGPFRCKRQWREAAGGSAGGWPLDEGEGWGICFFYGYKSVKRAFFAYLAGF
jgi:hypothetical protein